MQNTIPQQVPEPHIVIISADSPYVLIGSLVFTIVAVVGLITYGIRSKTLSGGWRIVCFLAAAGIAGAAAVSTPGMIVFLFFFGLLIR